MIITPTTLTPNKQTIIGSCGLTHDEVVTFTTMFSQYDSEDIKDKSELKKKIKSIKKDLKYATGLRKKELQQELQLAQRELKLLR